MIRYRTFPCPRPVPVWNDFKEILGEIIVTSQLVKIKYEKVDVQTSDAVLFKIQDRQLVWIPHTAIFSHDWDNREFSITKTIAMRKELI